MTNLRIPKHMRRFWSSRKKKRKPKKKSKEKLPLKQRRLLKARENPQRVVWLRAKRLAKLRNWDFDLEEDELRVPTSCPVLGIPIQIKSFEKDRSVSIDRVDSKKGYVLGNVVVVSWRANRLKSDATPDELRALADFYELRRQKSKRLKVSFKGS